MLKQIITSMATSLLPKRSAVILFTLKYFVRYTTYNSIINNRRIIIRAPTEI